MDSLFIQASFSADLAAAHRAEQTLADQLAAAVGGPVKVYLAGAADLDGTLMRVGRDHLWVVDRHGVWLVSMAHVDGLSGWKDVVPRGDRQRLSGEIAQRGLASALRELMDTGRQISVLVGERWFSGAVTVVGADFLALGDVRVPVARLRACRVWH